MEMHQLRYFVSVVKTGSFSKAAAACNVSQPSLSQQILKLEEELGEPLFERQSRGVALTPAAHVLHPSAKRILAEAEEARRLVLQARGDVRGRVTVGVLPTIAPYLLPPLMQLFSKKFPHAEFIVQEDTTARLLVALDNSEIDLGILSLPVEAPFLSTRKLFDDELLLAMPEGHRLAQAPQIMLKELSDEEFILLKEGHCLADQSEQFCQESANFCPRVACRSAQMETVLAMIRSRLGISLVPKLVEATQSAEGLVLRSLSPKIYRTIVLAERRNRHHCLVARGFQECVQTFSEQFATVKILSSNSDFRPSARNTAPARSLIAVPAFP